MAGSRYAYVKSFELPDPLLPTTFFIIRLDGKGFHKFSKLHNFIKPNDILALNLMNLSAKRVMNGKELNGDCILSFGESDEFSFIFKRSCKLHGRRSSKLVSLVTSLFTSAYIFLWPQFFPNSPLQLNDLPIFDGRIVQYSTELEIKDYVRWRQVDTHINNMYNTCFWSLVQIDGLTNLDANKLLNGTISSQKQEMLYSRFKINYNDLPELFRKGSILIWEDLIPTSESLSLEEGEEAVVEGEVEEEVEVGKEVESIRKRKIKPPKIKREVIIIHEDLISDTWWELGRGKGILEG